MHSACTEREDGAHARLVVGQLGLGHAPTFADRADLRGPDGPPAVNTQGPSPGWCVPAVCWKAHAGGLSPGRVGAKGVPTCPCGAAETAPELGFRRVGSRGGGPEGLYLNQ